MDATRLLAWLFSAIAHVAVIGLLVAEVGGSANEAGSGTDQFRLESGIGIESVVTFGEAAETVAQTEAAALPVAQAAEVRPEDVKEDTPPAIATVAESPETTVATQETPPQERTEEQAKAEPIQQAQEEQQKAMSANQSGGLATKLSAYYGAMSRAFARYQVKPRKRGAGVAVVRFSIEPSGRVISREIETNSGSDMIDDAALASVDRASPLPPVPPEIIAAGPLTFSQRFNFILR